MRAQARLAKDREERGQADELAGAMFEFFAGVFEHVGAQASPTHLGHEPNGNSGTTRTSSMGDLPPLPSPDSITVTTEFGVVEEPANINVTTVSTGIAPWQLHTTTHFHHPYPHEENQVEMTENLHEALGWTHMSFEQVVSMHQDAVDEAVDEAVDDAVDDAVDGAVDEAAG